MCMCVCMQVHRCGVCMCVHEHTCRGQRSVSGIAPQEMSTLVFETVSLIVTWSSLTRLAGKS